MVGNFSTIHGWINPYCVGPIWARVRYWRIQQRKRHAQGTTLYQGFFSPWSLAFLITLDDTENWGANSQPLNLGLFTSLVRQQAKLYLKKVIKNIKSNYSICSKFPFIKNTFICQLWFGLFLPTIFPICSWTEQNKTDKATLYCIKCI